MLGEWFNVLAVGFDTYHFGLKIVFSGINEKTVLKFLGIDQKKGKISHNILSPLHKFLYNIERRFTLPRNSKRSEVSLRDATLIYCMANHIKINFPSLMISYLSDRIEKGSFVGYGGLMTWIFKKFGVPLDGLQFPMGPNMKIGAKCLHNLHLKLNDEGILLHAVEEAVYIKSEEEKVEEPREQLIEEDKEVKEEKEQEPVPTATTETTETWEQGEAASKGESEDKGEAMEDDDYHILGSDSSDEEIVIAMRSRLVQYRGKVGVWLLNVRLLWMMTSPLTTSLSLQHMYLPLPSQPHHHHLKFHHQNHHLYSLHQHHFQHTLHQV